MTIGCMKYKLSVPIKLQKPVEDGRSGAFKGFLCSCESCETSFAINLLVCHRTGYCDL